MFAAGSADEDSEFRLEAWLGFGFCFGVGLGPEEGRLVEDETKVEGAGFLISMTLLSPPPPSRSALLIFELFG